MERSVPACKGGDSILCSLNSRSFQSVGLGREPGGLIAEIGDRWADSTGRRNTLIMEVLRDGDEVLVCEDERGS